MFVFIMLLFVKKIDTEFLAGTCDFKTKPIELVSIHNNVAFCITFFMHWNDTVPCLTIVIIPRLAIFSLLNKLFDIYYYCIIFFALIVITEYCMLLFYLLFYM